MTRKTETIKARSIYVYTPNLEMVERWKEVAKKRKQSISGFVVETVEDTIAASEEEEGTQSRAELTHRIKELNKQVATLIKDLQRYRTLIDRQEAELKDYRAQPFLDEQFEGQRSFPKDLIELLRAHGVVRYEDLHLLMGIKPGSNASLALQVQMNALGEYGLIEETDRFVRWLG